MSIDIITIDNSHNSDKTINDAYTTLYNSLGVESGLLSKTSIGQNLNKKYRDDSIDAKVYAIKYMEKTVPKNSENTDGSVIIENYTPINNSDILPESTIIGSAADITAAPIIDDSMWQIMRKFQLSNHLSTEEVVAEITEYLKKYAPIYRISTI